jgi:hypothetical protein
VSAQYHRLKGKKKLSAKDMPAGENKIEELRTFI